MKPEEAFTARELRIFCPVLPPEGLYPNKQSHHFTKYHLGKQYHRDVRLCALDALHVWERHHGQRWEPLSKATIALTFIFPASRPGPLPDTDNLIAAWKSGQDALTARARGYDIVGAGIIEDDGPEHLMLLPITIARNTEGIGVTIEIWEVLKRC